jgi:hypothetical protein
MATRQFADAFMLVHDQTLPCRHPYYCSMSRLHQSGAFLRNNGAKNPAISDAWRCSQISVSSQSAFHVYLICSKNYRADERLAASRFLSVSWPGNDDFGEQVCIPHYGAFSTAPDSVVFTCSLIEAMAVASGPNTMFLLFGKPNAKPNAFAAHDFGTLLFLAILLTTTGPRQTTPCRQLSTISSSRAVSIQHAHPTMLRLPKGIIQPSLKKSYVRSVLEAFVAQRQSVTEDNLAQIRLRVSCSSGCMDIVAMVRSWNSPDDGMHMDHCKRK